MLGDLGPAVAMDLVKVKDLPILLGGPLDLLDVWIEMIVPSIAKVTRCMLEDWTIKEISDFTFRLCRRLAGEIKYNGT